jgi:uncharacterized protein involved in response to NO
MEIIILGNGKMEQRMDMVFLSVRMTAQCMMEIGEMISMMDMELKAGKIIPLFIKGNINKVKKLAKENSNLMEIIMKVILLMVSFMEKEYIILLIRTQPMKGNFIKII